MMEKRTLADVLERLAKVGQAHLDGFNPFDAEGACRFCFLNSGGDSLDSGHELWCAWVEGKKLSYSDITAVQRLARVLRYEV